MIACTSCKFIFCCQSCTDIMLTNNLSLLLHQDAPSPLLRTIASAHIYDFNLLWVYSCTIVGSPKQISGTHSCLKVIFFHILSKTCYFLHTVWDMTTFLAKNIQKLPWPGYDLSTHNVLSWVIEVCINFLAFNCFNLFCGTENPCERKEEHWVMP